MLYFMPLVQVIDDGPRSSGGPLAPSQIDGHFDMDEAFYHFSADLIPQLDGAFDIPADSPQPSLPTAASTPAAATANASASAAPASGSSFVYSDAASDLASAAASPASSIITQSSTDVMAFVGPNGLLETSSSLGPHAAAATATAAASASCYYGCSQCNLAFDEQSDLEAHISNNHADTGGMATQVLSIARSGTV